MQVALCANTKQCVVLVWLKSTAKKSHAKTSLKSLAKNHAKPKRFTKSLQNYCSSSAISSSPNSLRDSSNFQPLPYSSEYSLPNPSFASMMSCVLL